jgi:hypothetical protein
MAMVAFAELRCIVKLTLQWASATFLIVGDYDPLNNESVQHRKVEQPAFRDFPGFDLVRIEPVTFPGFFPVQFRADSFLPVQGVNVTLVGYGSTSSSWSDGQTTYPEVAFEATLQVTDFEYCEEAYRTVGVCYLYFSSNSCFCAAVLNPNGLFPFDPIGPCTGACEYCSGPDLVQIPVP